ncbi:calcium-binding and coiled-coil domain-containing protein 1 isoform X1 [Hemibagrus wyckioides]|uniref:calcium-binding and coiled-coil domain-containing protein 1 isoform X1 n=1 Tax=Hemibagrus wyckioides TaxID=337641 RepID=UPI00266D2711|nr:calcium-binding and coiled-coil domain-containing protein 1 isoform X1 [Hemibagrus wyckioides]XP_058265835.1 calcium-binding and coiled-coil domain-containing protein 1 isoform X1 [Hemibagrus wyckioides]XP_058265837.1 calcium-binding and coiled-coil domain-containing protein 1 isoform X1 [Hemibagrus wyckioides]
MEKARKVEFQNVGSSYFPQSRVECHYSISDQHSWTSSDWIGLFKVGWSSVRNYHTFVWAVAPTSYKEGTHVNCCVHFQACYLPGPGAEQYQFVYVDGKGDVCSCSSAFTFSAPKPLEELVTLEQSLDGGEGSEDMLVVIPKAELLQSRLQECLKERAELLQALEAAERSREHERECSNRTREVWERRSKELEEELRLTSEQMDDMKKKQEELAALTAVLQEEKQALLAKDAASKQRNSQLEDDIRVLTQKALEKETDLERMKERAKKATAQKKDVEGEYKNMKLKLEQTEKELHSLSTEFQSLRSSLAQRDTHALQLRDTITTLTHKLNNAHRKEAASETALAELRSVQERLNASERCVETLRAEIRDMSAQRDTVQADLHQARLQAAQLTLQLADANLALREARASWVQERESLQCSTEVTDESSDNDGEMIRTHLDRLNDEIKQKEEQLQEERMERNKAEVELGREKDCNRVQLSETRRELQELKASLRVAQKEKEQLQAEKKEVIEYIHQLEQRLETLSGSKWSMTALLQSSQADSSMSESEDENPEALRPVSHYSLCEQPQSDLLLILPTTPPPSPRLLHSSQAVVISQPAPLCSPHQPSDDTHPHVHSSESEEEYEAFQTDGNSSEEMALLLPNHRNAILSDVEESPLW